MGRHKKCVVPLHGRSLPQSDHGTIIAFIRCKLSRSSNSLKYNTKNQGVRAPMGQNKYSHVDGKGHRRSTAMLLLLIGITLMQAVVMQPAAAQPAHSRLLYAHSLASGQSEQGITLLNTNGNFFNGGWEITTSASQLFITLPEGAPLEGTLSVKVKNFDPYEQSTDDLKHPIIDLYSQPCGNKDIYETDGAWFHLITGINYQSGEEGEAGFKFWAAPRGVDTKVEEQFMTDATWQTGKTYEFSFTWSGTALYFLIDGAVQMELPYAGQVEPFRYIFLGKDNLLWGYSAQPGPIFSDLRLYGHAESDPAPARPTGVRVIFAE
jgi:hypothetical protein